MSKKYEPGQYDDTDDEEVVMLGSRFLHAVHAGGKREPNRYRDDDDTWGGRTRRSRPRPVRDRS